VIIKLSLIPYRLEFMRLLFLLCLLSSQLLSQIEIPSDVQYNLLVQSDASDEFEVEYEMRIPGEGNNPDRVYLTTSQDSFLLMLYQDLKSADSEKSQLLLHIHGMWGGRRMNFNRAYKLLETYFLKRPESDFYRLINVKWPGNEMEYKINRAKILEIADPLQELIVNLSRKIQLINFLNNNVSTRMDLIAHSLGNVLLEEMVQNINSSEFTYPLFSEVVLAAPDLEVDAFLKEGRMADFHKLCERAHVYFSTKDLTLGVSSNLNDRSRLGLSGPVADSQIADNIFFIDCSILSDEDKFGDRMTGHSYYRASPIATMDMLESFKSKQAHKIDRRKLTNETLNIFQIQYEAPN